MRSSMSGSPSNATARDTVLSYRDTWRLYLRFVAGRHRRSVSSLTLAELTADEVLAFLKHVESERRTSIGTRNCRLAAIRSFYRFVVDREPLAAMQCAAVLRIPIKKGPRAEPEYLDSEEVAAILRQPDRSTPEGQRDHALLAFLYNTGAHPGGASLCPGNIRLRPRQVKLYGKGRKERISTVARDGRTASGPAQAAAGLTTNPCSSIDMVGRSVPPVSVQARAVRPDGCEGTAVCREARAPARSATRPAFSWSPPGSTSR
jgi:site-specific recombinase XerD